LQHAAVQEDIVAVNQIFKDLGLLVHEQADVIGQFVQRLIVSFAQNLPNEWLNKPFRWLQGSLESQISCFLQCFGS